jgi:site-specific DNA recombinase
MRKQDKALTGIGEGLTVAYVRVSTDGQETDGNGLDVQRQGIVAYAAAQLGGGVDHWITDIESGAAFEREGLAELRGLVAAGGVARVLVYRMDRLSRDVLLSESLHRELSKHTAVVSVSESFGDGFTGDLMRHIMAAFAHYERALIATRTKGGRRASVKARGTFAGGSGVFGYRPVGKRGAPGSGGLVIDEREAAAVRRCFALHDAGGSSLASIARALDAEGFKPREGGTFSKVHVHRIIARRGFYSGAVVLTRSVGADQVAHAPIL